MKRRAVRLLLQPLLKAMSDLITVHESLLSMAVQKSEKLKQNELEAFNDLIKMEQKHIQALEQLEKVRLKAAKDLAVFLNLQEDASVTDIIARLPLEKDQQRLEEKATALLEAVLHIKQQEDLNRQLLKQSLQFVQLQLDLMEPSVESMTYGTKKIAEDPKAKRSVFDSKA